MKVYKFGEDVTSCFNIIIEEDNGDIKVAFVGVNHVKEYLAEIKNCGDGIERLVYANGSSMPYKKLGKICDKYFLVYED